MEISIFHKNIKYILVQLWNYQKYYNQPITMHYKIEQLNVTPTNLTSPENSFSKYWISYFSTSIVI